MKKAFTLAEIMIVLTIIGVLTAILLPVARNTTPNKDVMKFKRAHNTLYSAINELVNSDKYYLDGDLGVKADGNLVDSATYFCETIADVLNVQNVNCSSYGQGNEFFVQFGLVADGTSSVGTLEEAKSQADVICETHSSNVEAEVILNDDVVFYQTSSKAHYGITWDEARVLIGREPNGDGTYDVRQFGYHVDPNGFDRVYKVFCIDVDGIAKGEKPFGYGIRVDGKIVSGARADEWLEKSIQEKD